MIVKELIERLQIFDGDLPVHWEENGGITTEVQAAVKDVDTQNDPATLIVLLTTANSSRLIRNLRETKDITNAS